MSPLAPIYTSIFPVTVFVLNGHIPQETHEVDFEDALNPMKLPPIKEAEMAFASRWRIVPLAAMVFSALLMTTCFAKAQGRPGAAPSAAEETLKRFLQSWDNDKRTRYAAAFRDLNGDGIPEAIVYLVGPEWCGSGGCNTLILTQDDGSWRIVANITITQPPIRVLTDTSHGWRSVGVWVQGGGIQPGYEAELRFDGKSYPRNPTVPPARRLTGKPAGEVVIGSARDATPLY